MSLEDNRELVRRFYREAINGRDLDTVDRLLSEDFTHDGELKGHAGQRQAVAYFLEAFPDLHNEIELLVAEGDLVAARQRWTAPTADPFSASTRPARASSSPPQQCCGFKTV